MKVSAIENLIRECFNEEHIILENLILKRYGDKLAVISDASDRKGQSAETFRNKDKLSKAGFKWDSSINSWTISNSQLQKAQEVLQAINKSPISQFIEKLEEIPEFIENTDNLSKKDELSQKIDGYINDLTTAVDDAAASAAIKNFLAFNAKFHGYSFSNTMLIYLQNKNATKVAGFKQWQDKFHRRVKKGAKGISILAPISRKEKDDKSDTGADNSVQQTPTPVPTDKSDLQDKDKKKSFMHFMAVTVFDIADTEPIDERGEIPDVKWHSNDEPNAKADELYECVADLADSMGIKLTQNNASHGEMGYSAGGHINITSNINGVNKASTLVHEIAHELLHHKQSSMFYVGDDVNLSKEMKELQAESVSYIVIKHYDLPVEHHSTYLALWKANKDAIKNNLTIIKKTSDFIIKEIDKIHDDRQKQTMKTNEPTTVNESFDGSPTHIFTVEYNDEGKKLIESLRNLVKQKGYNLILRGRGHRFGLGKPTVANGGNNQYQSSIPLEKAQKVAVYITKRNINPSEENNI